MDKLTYFNAVATPSYNLQPPYQLCDPYIKLRFYRYIIIYRYNLSNVLSEAQSTKQNPLLI